MHISMAAETIGFFREIYLLIQFNTSFTTEIVDIHNQQWYHWLLETVTQFHVNINDHIDSFAIA